MKKIKYLVLSIFSFYLCIVGVHAATSSISAAKQVEVGRSVKATVTVNAAAWDIRVNGTGNTNGCSTHDTNVSDSGKNIKKYITVSCTANSTGIIRITYSGDITDASGSTKDVSGTATVNVVAARPKSSNNYLKGLSVEGGVLTPEFNKNTSDYSVTFEPGTEKVVINATKEDSYASISGVGEKEVIEGDNKFEIVVTSETGSSRTYTLNVIVKEFVPINVTVKNRNYTVARKLTDIDKPVGFEPSTVQIGEDSIEAFYNENTNMYLVGLKDADGKVYLFEYNDGKYNRYYEFTFAQLTLNIIEMDKTLVPDGYSKFKAAINNEEIDVYKKSKTSKFALVYGVDVSTGDKGLYQVDLKNNTVQLFNDEFVKTVDENNNKILIVLAIAGAIILIEFLIILIVNGKKKKIINKIKDVKVEKVKSKALKDAKEETVEAQTEEKKKSKK